MRKLTLAAALATGLASSGPAHEQGMVLPRRQEQPKPPTSRDDRKKHRRRFGSLPKRLIHALNRPYVAHERGQGDAPLCRAGWALPFGPHRFADQEPVMCNDCQRTRWQLDQQARKAS
jgi:hypothetical protein